MALLTPRPLVSLVRLATLAVHGVMRPRRIGRTEEAFRQSAYAMLPTMDAEPSPREIMTAVLDLHGAVVAGFAMVESRLGRVELRLDRVEARLDRVEARLDGVEGRLTSISGEVAGLQRWRIGVDSRLERLERAYLS